MHFLLTLNENFKKALQILSVPKLEASLEIHN